MNTTGFEALRDILGPNRYELKFYPHRAVSMRHLRLSAPALTMAWDWAEALPVRAGWMRLLHSGKSTGQPNKGILAGILLPC